MYIGESNLMKKLFDPGIVPYANEFKANLSMKRNTKIK